MNYSHFLNKATIRPQKLKAFGFSETGDFFELRRLLSETDFYAVVKITKTEITVHAYENQTDEKYALLDVASANGAFVGNLREKVSELMNQIFAECFETADVKQKYVDYLESEFGVKGEFPWDGDNSSVYRCPNGKWFGLLMQIPFKKLGFESEELVWCVNLKADEKKIPELVDRKSIFPAWHMNKKYWITIILTSVTSFEQLKELTGRSFELVMKKK
ncbi:MAG: MmcQ/YjbR family DNA-binding protein [Treponema sp.]|nr:MmcQ/YjbR family DNA-binding protein [Treponema sp.]